jgi:hypothetical protein
MELTTKTIREKHGDSHTPLHSIWLVMKDRCNNPKNYNYHRYGGNNIKVCKTWQVSYLSFKEWSIKNGYKKGLSLDRINNNGDYSPENCRWADRFTQSANTKKIRINNTSGYRGVSWHSQSKKWRCNINVNNKQIYLGKSLDKTELALKYDKYIKDNNLEHTTNF